MSVLGVNEALYSVLPLTGVDGGIVKKAMLQ